MHKGHNSLLLFAIQLCLDGATVEMVCCTMCCQDGATSVQKNVNSLVLRAYNLLGLPTCGIALVVVISKFSCFKEVELKC